MAYDSQLSPSDMKIPGVSIGRLPQTSENDLDVDSLEAFIGDAEADVWAELKSHRLAPDDLADEGERAANRVVRAYTALHAQEHLGHSGEVLDKVRTAYERAWQTFRLYAQELAGQTSGTIYHDTQRNPDDTFIGHGADEVF